MLLKSLSLGLGYQQLFKRERRLHIPGKKATLMLDGDTCRTIEKGRSVSFELNVIKRE